MGCAGVLLYLERVVLDVVDGRQDDAPAVLLDPREGRLGPVGKHTAMRKAWTLGSTLCPEEGPAHPQAGAWATRLHLGLMAP